MLSTTQPPIDGVVLSVIRTRDGGAGFAKCHIPASDRPPHMAKDSRYYRRTSSGRRCVEHFEVEDMFARRRGPKLELTVTARQGGMELVVGLKNTGRGSAKAPYLALGCPPPFRGSWGLTVTVLKVSLSYRPKRSHTHGNMAHMQISLFTRGRHCTWRHSLEKTT